MVLDSGAPWVLVGREDERAAAADGFRQSRGVLIVGSPGSGKTVLARAVIGDRPPGNTEVQWLLAGGAGPSIPFAAFAPVVPEAAAGTATFDLLQRVRRAVLELAGSRRLLLAVDDAHRLDEASATLVFQLVASGEADLVATAVAGEPLAEPVRVLWKEGLVRRIDLAPLGRDGCVELASRWLEGHVDGELAEGLWRMSGGNPLYLRELIWAAKDNGRLVSSRGMWRSEKPLVMGPRLTELAMARVGRLRRAERSTFEVVAFAEPVPMDALSHLAPGSSVSWLQRHGMIRIEECDGEPYVSSATPVHAEVVRAQLPAPRQQELRLELATAFERAGRLGVDLLRVMRWRLDAGCADDPEVLLEAGRRAAQERDWALAGRLARLAVEGGKGSAAARLLADALHREGSHEAALAALGEWRGDGDHEIAGLAVLRAQILYWGLGRMDEADETLRTAEVTVTDPSGRLLVAATRAGMLTFRGRPAEAAAYLRPLLEQEGLSARAVVAARTTLSLALAWSGRPDEAVDVLDNCAPAVLESGDEGPGSVRWTVHARLSAYRMAGRLTDMEALAEREYSRAVASGNREAQGGTAGALGWVALGRGELAKAISYFDQSVATLAGADCGLVRRQSLTGLTEALALSGDADAAAEALAEAEGSAAGSVSWVTCRVSVSRAWVTAARGEISAAVGEFLEAASLARSNGQVAQEILALHCAARLGETRVAGRLAELATWVQGPLVQISSAFATALGDGDGDGLDRVADRWEELTMWLQAAEAAAHASRVHHAAGSPRRAAASATRARCLLDRCGGAHPLGVAITLASPTLTRRELEVAGLAVNGLSSPTIADRLCLSVRTVDTHLSRVYSKLGVTGRHELAGALGSG